MTQYDKDTLVREIERRKKYYENIQMIKPVYESNIEDFNELLLFIDTLEVKEVDLEKEIDLVEDKYHGFESLSRADIIDVAKHFFELGMSVSNKAEKEVEEESYVMGKTGRYSTTTK